jgi:LmeA-like phospholipid-binding
MSKPTLFVLLVLTFILLAPYTFLPGMLGSVLGRTLQDQFGLERTPEVELASDPPPVMYAGSFSKALISVQGLNLGGVKAERVVLEPDPFNVNLLDSVSSGTLSTAAPLSGRIQVELSEDDALNLVQNVAALPVQGIDFEKDQVVFKFGLGYGASTSVRGNLLVQNGALTFEPQQVEGTTGGIPAAQLFALTRFAYPVTGLPFGAELSGAKVLKDHLILTGEIHNIPLSSPTG